MPQRFGDWVRKVRLAKGQTLPVASAAIEVSRIQFIAWEQHRALPRVQSVFKLADWAGVKVDDLRAMFCN